MSSFDVEAVFSGEPIAGELEDAEEEEVGDEEERKLVTKAEVGTKEDVGRDVVVLVTELVGRSAESTRDGIRSVLVLDD